MSPLAAPARAEAGDWLLLKLDGGWRRTNVLAAAQALGERERAF